MTTREWFKREWFKLGLLVLLVPAVWNIALNGIDLHHHGGGGGSAVDFPSRLALDVRGVDFPSSIDVTGMDFPSSISVTGFPRLNIDHDFGDLNTIKLDLDFPSSIRVTGVDFPSSISLDTATGYIDVKHHAGPGWK